MTEDFAYLILKRRIASTLLDHLYRSRLGWARNTAKSLSALAVCCSNDHRQTPGFHTAICAELLDAHLITILLNVLEHNIVFKRFRHSHLNWLKDIAETLSVFAEHGVFAVLPNCTFIDSVADNIRTQLIDEGLISILLRSLKSDSHDDRSSGTRMLALLVRYSKFRRVDADLVLVKLYY